MKLDVRMFIYTLHYLQTLIGIKRERCFVCRYGGWTRWHWLDELWHSELYFHVSNFINFKSYFACLHQHETFKLRQPYGYLISNTDTWQPILWHREWGWGDGRGGWGLRDRLVTVVDFKSHVLITDVNSNLIVANICRGRLVVLQGWQAVPELPLGGHRKYSSTNNSRICRHMIY